MSTWRGYAPTWRGVPVYLEGVLMWIGVLGGKENLPTCKEIPAYFERIFVYLKGGYLSTLRGYLPS